MSFTKNGEGALTLTNSNSYTGGTILNAGTLTLGSADSLGAPGGNLTLNGGTLDLNVSAPGVGDVVFNGGNFVNGTLYYATAFEVQTGSLAAALDGESTLTKTGPGTFTLSGDNTYTGGTIVSAGTLAVISSANLGDASGDVTVEAGSTLATGADFVADRTISASGAGALVSNTGNLNIGYNTTGSLALSNGAALEASNLNIGYNNGSSGSVEVNSSSAVTADNDVTVGWQSGSVGDVTISDTGSRLEVLNDDGYYLGWHGAGTTTIGNGGILRAPFVAIASSSGSSGALNLNAGGTLETGGLTTGAGADTFNFAGGTLRATGDFSSAVPATLSGATSAVDTNGSDITLSGTLSGPGAFTKEGIGTLTLSGTNTYAGGTTLEGGTLQVASDANLGAAPASVTPDHFAFAGGTLGTTATFTLNPNRGIALDAAGGTFDTASGTTLTYGGIVAGEGDLTKTGAGTLTLSGNNTFTGATTVSDGTILLGQANALGTLASVTVADGATLDLNGNSVSLANIEGTGNIALDSATLTTGDTGNATVSVALSGNGGGFTKTGSGAITLAGTNTYTGNTTVSAGTLLFSDPQSLYNSDTAQWNKLGVASGASVAFDISNLSFGASEISALFNNATFDSGARSLELHFSDNYTLTEDIDLDLSNTSTPEAALTLSGATPVRLSGNTFTLGAAANQSLTVDRPFAGGSDGSDGPSYGGQGGNYYGDDGEAGGEGGHLIHSGNDVSFLQAVTLSGGDGGDGGGIIGGTRGGSGGSGGTLNLAQGSASFDQTVNLSGGSGGIGRPGGSQIGSTGTTGGFGGSGGNLIHSGDSVSFAQTLILSGGDGGNGTAEDNGGTGGTGGNGGTLSITQGSASFDETVNMSGGSGGVGGVSNHFAGKGGTGGAGGNGGTLSITQGSASFTETVNLSGGIGGMGGSAGDAHNMADAGDGGNGGDGGALTVTGGTVDFATGAALDLSAGSAGSAGNPGSQDGEAGSPGSAGTAGTLSLSGGTLQLPTAGWLESTSTFSGNFAFTGGTLKTTDSGEVLALDGSSHLGLALADANVTDTRTLDLAGNLDFSGVFAGSGGLTKAGAGTLSLSGNNTYSGATIIETGTLQLGADHSLGNTTAVTVNDPATLSLNGFSATIGSLAGGGNVTLGSGSLTTGDNNSHIFSGVISGNGSLTKSGEGTQTLSGANTYSGGTTISGGALQLGDGGNSGSVAGDIANDGALVFNRSDDYQFDGVVSGSGGLTHDGAILRLANPQTYTGPTSVKSGGYLVLSTSSDQGLSAATTVDLEAGSFLDISNRPQTLSGLSGSGAVYSYGGSAGHLTVNTAFGQNQTFSGSLGSDHPHFAFSKTGEGALTLTGDNSHTGGTTISDGILQIGNGGTSGSLGGNITNNSTLVFNRSDDFTFHGVVSGTGELVNDGNNLRLSEQQTYTGPTSIHSGLLILSGNFDDTLSTSTKVHVAEGAQFDISNRSQTIAGLSGEGLVYSYIASESAAGHLTVDHSDDQTFSGTLGGDHPNFALTKSGEGTLTLSGDFQATGTTAVNQGTLEFTHGILSEGAEILLAETGTLATGGTVARDLCNNGNVVSLGGTPLTFTGDVSGTGQFAGDFVFSGTTRPGESPGLMEVEGDLTFGPDHILEMEIAGLSRGTEYDAFDITGSLNLDGTLEVVFLGGFEPEAGNSFHFFQVGETITGAFADIVLPDLAPRGLNWDTSSLYSTGTLGVIPEPGTYALLFGLAAIGFAVWRKRKAAGEGMVG